MPKKQLAVKAESLENLTSNPTNGSTGTRSRRRGVEVVNYRESGGDDYTAGRSKVDVAPNEVPYADAPAVRKKKPAKSKKVVIVAENDEMDIFDTVEDVPLPPVKEPLSKGSKVGRKKKAEALTENHSINQPTVVEAFSVPSDTSKSKGDLQKKVPPPPPSPKQNDATGAMNSTYVKENEQQEMRSSALTSQDLQLSEESSDEDVEEKEKRKLKKQAEENPFSFKKYVEKVQTVPHSDSGADLKQDSAKTIGIETDLECPSTSSSTEDLSQENQETRHLELEHQLANRNRRVEELEKELKRMRKREAQETASLDKQLKVIETNYAAALERIKALEVENFRLQQKVERQQRGEVDIPEEYLLKQADLSDKMKAMASGAEAQLNELLKGVKDMQQLIQLLNSMHKFSEETTS